MSKPWSDSFHSPLSGACDYYFECSCDQCEQQDGRNVEAKGYCSDCQAHLCQECYATHLRPKTMRHHVLLDENRMPKKEQPSKSKDICIEACPIHPDKKLKYVCPKHKDFGCGVCVTLNHRDCKGVDYIPDVAGGVLTSNEYTEFQRKITDLTNNANTSIQTSQDKAKLSRTVNAGTHEAMKKFRKDIINAVDRIEKTVLPEADRLTAEDEKKMQLLEEKFKKILVDVQALDARLTSLKNSGQFCQMFIALQRAPSEIAGLEGRLEEHSRDTEVQKYRRTLSGEAKAFLQSPEKMVRLEKFDIDQTHQNVNSGKVLSHMAYQSSLPKPPPPPTQYPCYTTVRHSQTESSKQQDAYTSGAHVIFRPTDCPPPPPPPPPDPKQKVVGNDQAAPSKLRKKTKAERLREIKELAHEKSYKPKVTKPVAVAAKQRSTSIRKTHAEHVMDINVRGINDRDTADITSSILLPGGKLVIVDANNSKVKLIELAYVKITSELELSLWIWDITQINNIKVAVMSYKKNVIYVVNVSNKLTLDNVVDVKGQCKGIDCIDNKFILTYDEPAKIEIVSMTGQVLKIIVAKESGGLVFTQPRHLAINNKQQIVYVSDFARDTVTSLDLSGEVKAIYTDKNLIGPYKLAVTKAGSVYICGYDTNNIHLVNGDLSKGQIVLEKSDGVTRPQTISCCDVTGSLYIGMWRSDTLKVYQLKEA